MTLSIYQLKPRFQRLLAPLLTALTRAGVSPNLVTSATLIGCISYGLLLWRHADQAWPWWGLPLCLLLRMALNALDGMLANETGRKTRLGALLNELGDVLADLALSLPFAAVAGIHAPLLIAVVIGALLVEFAGVLALQIGTARRFDGPMGKSDRAFAYGLLAILVALRVVPGWWNGLLAALLPLLAWTAFNRLRAALRSAPGAVPPTP